MPVGVASQFMSLLEERFEILLNEHFPGGRDLSHQSKRSIVSPGQTELSQNRAARQQRRPRKIIERKRDQRSFRVNGQRPPKQQTGSLSLIEPVQSRTE